MTPADATAIAEAIRAADLPAKHLWALLDELLPLVASLTGGSANLSRFVEECGPAQEPPPGPAGPAGPLGSIRANFPGRTPS